MAKAKQVKINIPKTKYQEGELWGATVIVKTQLSINEILLAVKSGLENYFKDREKYVDKDGDFIYGSDVLTSKATFIKVIAYSVLNISNINELDSDALLNNELYTFLAENVKNFKGAEYLYEQCVDEIRNAVNAKGEFYHLATGILGNIYNGTAQDDDSLPKIEKLLDEVESLKQSNLFKAFEKREKE